MVANNPNVRFTQDELTHWTLDTYNINSLKPNVILLQMVPFKRALSITRKLTNHPNITRYSPTPLCFLNGGQNIRKVGVTGGDKSDKAGDILKPIHIYWNTFITLYRLKTTHRDGATPIRANLKLSPQTIWVQNGRFKTQRVKSSTL